MKNMYPYMLLFYLNSHITTMYEIKEHLAFGEKTASSISGAGKIGQVHVKV